MTAAVPFISHGWKYYGTWEETAMLCAVRERGGSAVSAMVDANRGWLDTLHKLSSRRYAAEVERLRTADEAARSARVRSKQPCGEDGAA